MSDDLTELLRNLAARFGRCRDQETVQKAADEIERLRAENERLREALTMFTMFYPFGISLELDQAFRTARAALGEEKKR
jgi:CRISPR/Cas system-associated protein Csm6